MRQDISVRSLDDLLADPPDLPVVGALDALDRAIHTTPALIVTTAPGSGKTTLLPPLLAVAVGAPNNPPTPSAPNPTRVIVTQPRRVAARAAARRIASLLGEEVGQTVGYTVRGDRRTSAATRIEMVTPGVLVRRLQRDPSLPGVKAVMLDEFHERQIDTDLALAMLLSARRAGLTNARLTITSATLDTDRLAAHLADQLGTAPAHVDIPTPRFPLEIAWAPPPRGVSPLTTTASGHTRVSREFLAHIARTTASAAARSVGDILVFVPGVREIDEVTAHLRDHFPDAAAEILPLHGQLSAQAQDAVLTPRPSGATTARSKTTPRRIIVSTALAESALTVPGVRTVVDAGLSREPRFDAARGAGMLVTVSAAHARMEQRVGRAARLGPGLAIRCFDQSEWTRRPAHTSPEITTSDLADLQLQSQAWLRHDIGPLTFFDPAPAGALTAATEQLQSMWALSGDDAQVTELGQHLTRLPVHPALARALLEAAAIVGPREAAELVALVDSEPRLPNADLTELLRRPLTAEMRAQARRLEKLATPDAISTTLAALSIAVEGREWARGLGGSREDNLALVAALAHPQWIARQRPKSQGTTTARHREPGRRAAGRFILVDGQGAMLPEHSPLEASQWLAITQLTRTPGVAEATIRAAIPIDQAVAEFAATGQLSTQVEVDFVGGRLQATEVQSLGAIALSSRPLDRVPPASAAQALERLCQRQGIDFLPWSPAATSLRSRLAALHSALGDPWPDVSDEALARDAATWLSGEFEQVVAGVPLGSIDTLSALRALLPWPQAAQLNALAPESIEIPTGATRKIDWSSGQPAITLRVQEAFGWLETPTFAQGRLPLVVHLTDPAGRPTAVTSDLRSFWAGPYHQVRAQLRGRYPKHPWPEDPLSEPPTSRAKPRGRT